MKIALGIESSRSRGMGHLFRSLLFVEYLKQNNIEFIYLINNDEASITILESRGIPYQIVDYTDTASNWERRIIEAESISVWLNDKFETSSAMGNHIKDTGILFCLLDDVGEAEACCDIYFAGMIHFSKKCFHGAKVYAGNEYIILNPEIANYRHERHSLHKIIVSMGGSDPHLATYDIVNELLNYNYNADIIIGPNYRDKEKLIQLNRGRFQIMQNVPSLAETFSNYDLAITGGGVTCCEANAAGLPCIVIANAPHEENTGRYMQELGGCIYGGNYQNWDRELLSQLDRLNIARMSKMGMEHFDFKAIERITAVIAANVKEKGNDSLF